MKMKTKITEYWVRPLDEHGDSRDVIFCQTIKEAVSEINKLNGAPFELEKCVRTYYRDGELKDEALTLIDG